MTVSLALRNNPRSSKKTRERIQTLAAKMGYIPDPAINKLMSYLRTNKSHRSQYTLGYINLRESNYRDTKDEINSFYREAQQHAQHLGYTLQEFWAHEKGMTYKRLSDVLFARGIKGLIIGPTPIENHTLNISWERFTSVALGCTLREPKIHRVLSDRYQNTLLALRTLRERGYQRIGCAFNRNDDLYLDSSHSAGLLVFQEDLPTSECVPMLRPMNWSRKTFIAWYKRHKPDVVVSLSEDALEWLREYGCKVPEDVGFALLVVIRELTTISGINDNLKSLGQIAIEFIVRHLDRDECGIPVKPQTISIRGEWHEGTTVRPPSSISD